MLTPTQAQIVQNALYKLPLFNGIAVDQILFAAEEQSRLQLAGHMRNDNSITTSGVTALLEFMKYGRGAALTG